MASTMTPYLYKDCDRYKMYFPCDLIISQQYNSYKGHCKNMKVDFDRFVFRESIILLGACML